MELFVLSRFVCLMWFSSFGFGCLILFCLCGFGFVYFV